MNRPIKTLSPEQSDRLVACLQVSLGSSNNVSCVSRDQCMILLMLDAGLRVAEVSKLRRRDLWFGQGPVVDLTVPAEIAKNGIERIVPLSSRLREAIISLHETHWKSQVFPPEKDMAFFGRDTFSITTRQIQRIVKTWTFAATGESFNPHALRHTFATRMMRRTSMRTVQMLLGHVSITSTQVYTHPDIQDLRRAVNGEDATKT